MVLIIFSDANLYITFCNFIAYAKYNIVFLSRIQE